MRFCHFCDAMRLLSHTRFCSLHLLAVAPAITMISGKTISVEMLSHHVRAHCCAQQARTHKHTADPKPSCVARCSRDEQAGDFYEGMIAGDAGVTSVYSWSALSAPGVTAATKMRGASGGGDGVHVLTGPIYVTDAAGTPAAPGDVIKVDVLSLKPRLNPAGKSYGINAAAWCVLS
jgi:hypothetical protein